MAFENTTLQILNKLLDTIVASVIAKPNAVLLTVWEFIQHAFGLRHEGMYEVLEYETKLVLKDTHGEEATYYKRQRVRFLQDNIIAYQDQAWGDGDIFADYKCTPGVPVDRYREGNRYRILISLRESKKRGDIEEFTIQRTIKHGFTKAVEDFQTDLDHTTRKLRVSVIFPGARMPKEVSLIEKNVARTTSLGRDQLRALPDGRWQATWSIEKPKLFEAYILRWSW